MFPWSLTHGRKSTRVRQPEPRHDQTRTNLFTLTKNIQNTGQPKDHADAYTPRMILKDPIGNPFAMNDPPSRHQSPDGHGGGGRDRTDDPLLAKQVLSQLSYAPIP